MKPNVTTVLNLNSAIAEEGYLKNPPIKKWYPVKYFFWRTYLRTRLKSVLRKDLDADGIEAWKMFFEQEMEREKPHSLKDFIAHIKRFGVPDVGCLYLPQEEQYLQSHQGGFLAQHIEWVLVPFSSARLQAFSCAAKDRLSFLLYINAPMNSILKYWEKQDIQLACSIALLEGEYENFGVESRIAIRHALLGQWIDPALTLGLAANREWIERERYPSVLQKVKVAWKRWKRSRVKVKKLAIGSWREERSLAFKKAESVTTDTLDSVEK